MKKTIEHSAYDKILLITTFCIIALGLLMVYSSSIVIAEKLFHQPFHYVIKQIIYLFIGLFSALVVTRIPIETWYNIRGYLLLISIILLIAVLIPGIGHEVNGSIRWIRFGPVGFQVSELVKLFMAIFFAGYLVKHGDAIREHMTNFFIPLIIAGVIALLLLLEPDFGAAFIILSMLFGMLFLAQVPLRRFMILITVAALLLATLILLSPYRFARLTAFLHPWAHQYDSGYQLTQSLIAFGRGGLAGVGLGESIQKLFYLPEAHTDFIFAVIAEELGLLGEVVVLALYSLLIYRAMAIGRRAYQLGREFAAYLAYGIGFWLGLQAFINIGVTMGVLPTKGLTLPLMSYGGSSLVIGCVAIGLLLRIDHESRT